MTTVSAEDPSVKPKTPVQPQAAQPGGPKASAAAGAPAPTEAVQPEASATTPVTSPAPEKPGLIRRLRGKLNSGESLKPLTIIITAIVGFFFGIANNQVSDVIKRADDCYNALFMFRDNMFQGMSDITPDIHSPNAQKHASAYAKYRTEIAIPYNKVSGICAMHMHNSNTNYVKRSDVDAFLNDFYQLNSVCIFAPACSGDREIDLIQKMADSSAALMEEASKISQWGLRLRAWYALKHFW